MAREPERGEVIRRVLPSTVQLRSERAGGNRRAASGVVVAADPATGRAWIATARHFLDPATEQTVYARRPGRREAVPAGVRHLSGDGDLALLEVRGLALAPVPLKETAALGDEIWLIGFPWGRRATVVSGVVSQIVGRDGAIALEGAVRMVDASVSYGSSGAGVFDAATGALLGIVEGFRTAKVALPEAKDRVFELPVAGETTVIAVPAIRRALEAAGLCAFTAAP